MRMYRSKQELSSTPLPPAPPTSARAPSKRSTHGSRPQVHAMCSTLVACRRSEDCLTLRSLGTCCKQQLDAFEVAKRGADEQRCLTNVGIWRSWVCSRAQQQLHALDKVSAAAQVERRVARLTAEYVVVEEHGPQAAGACNCASRKSCTTQVPLYRAQRTRAIRTLITGPPCRRASGDHSSHACNAQSRHASSRTAVRLPG